MPSDAAQESGLSPDVVPAPPRVANTSGRAVLFMRRGLIGLAALIVVEAVLTLSFFGLLSAHQRTLAHEALPALLQAQTMARMVSQLDNEARALFSMQEPFAIESRLFQIGVMTRDLADAITRMPDASRKGELMATLESWQVLLIRIDEVQRRQIAAHERWLMRTSQIANLHRRIESSRHLSDSERYLALDAAGLLIAANATLDAAEIDTLARRFTRVLEKTRGGLSDAGLIRELTLGAAIFADRIDRLRQELHLRHLGDRLVLLDSLVDAVETIAEELSRETQLQADTAERRLFGMMWVLFAIIVAGIAIAFFGVVLVNRRILHRLLQLQQAMQAHVRGTPEPIPISGDDEIADMGRSFEHFVGKVGRREASLQETIAHLNTARESLVEAEKLASLGGLVAIVAHELNTPIGCAVTTVTTVLNEANKLNDKIGDGKAVGRKSLTEALERIATGSRLVESSLARAAKLIDSFKSVAIDQQQSERRKFQPAEILAHVAEATEPALKAAGHTITLKFEKVQEADGYPGALGQAVLQLIENALKHAFPPGTSGEVQLHCRPFASGRFQIEVCDNGCGIPNELLPRLFEPFFTTKMNQGTGLGLHIVHNIVRGLYGGEIQVDSRVGAGTCFRLSMPLVAPQRETASILATLQ